MMNKKGIDAQITPNNPILSRMIATMGLSPDEAKSILDGINGLHNVAAAEIWSTVAKLFDVLSSETTNDSSFYQFGTCSITDLEAGIEKRLYPSDLANMTKMNSISSFVDLGNMNVPEGADYIFLSPRLNVDVKGYLIYFTSIDTLKSIPTVTLETSRLVLDNQSQTLGWSVDKWSLTSQNPTNFFFRFLPSFPARNTSSPIAPSNFSNVLFSDKTNLTKYKHLLYDTYAPLFVEKGYTAWFVAPTIPADPMSVTFSFGVGTDVIINGANIAATTAAINGNVLLNKVFSATDDGITITITSIDPTIPMVSAIVTITTPGTASPNNLVQIGLAAELSHVYTQNQFTPGNSRNFYIAGGDNLRIVVIPITDLTNNVGSSLLDFVRP